MPLRLPPIPARTLGLSAAGWALLALARTAARVVAVPRPMDEVALQFGRILLASLPWILATPILIGLAERLSWRRGTRIRSLGVHLGVGLVWYGVESTWAWLALSWSGQPLMVSGAVWYVARLDYSLFLYLCLVAIGAAIRHRQRLDLAILASARLEGQLLHARLHVLSLQLHPHFLFNTLNAVSELVHRDAAAARRILTGLAELLRRSLRQGTGPEVPLEEELTLLETYIRIQQARFGESLTIAVEAGPRVLHCLVPTLLLQPLVENAIRHGTARRAAPGRIVVRAQARGDRLLLEVEDNGPGLPRRDDLREGMGLGNTRARLQQLHGAAASLTLESAAGGGTVARLECPLRRGAAGGGDDTAPEDAELRQEESVVSRSWWLAAALALGWVAVGALGTGGDYLAARLMDEPEPLGSLLAPRLADALLWLLLTPAVLWGAGRVARADPGWAALSAMHLVGATVISATHLGLTLLLVNRGMQPNLIAATLVIDLGIYVALAAAGHAWTIRRQATERRAAAQGLEAELAAARLDALRWRLHPDLLFRALETIGELAGTDPARADELTGRLGELLRLLLPSGTSDLVPLHTEIAFLDAYLHVAAAAGLAAPRLDVSIAAGAERMLVPGMLLQPLTEAVGGGTGGRLWVDAMPRNDGLALVVRGERPAETEVGDDEIVGNLRRRLSRIYGHDCELALERSGDVSVGSLVIPAMGAWREVA